MSTGMELIPIGLALGGVAGAGVVGAALAARAAGADAPAPREVRSARTRFTDEALVLEALGEGAVEHNGTLHGTADGVPVALAKDSEGTYVAYFHGDLPAPEAESALREVDGVYGGLVQRDVRRRVLEQAPAHGLSIEDETREDDGSIVLTLQVGG
jgi:hypothetical protein